MMIDKLVPDFMDIPVNKFVNFTILGKKYPQDSEEFSKGPFQIRQDTRKVNFRLRARQAKVKYSTSATDSFFQIGAPRLNITPDGER